LEGRHVSRGTLPRGADGCGCGPLVRAGAVGSWRRVLTAGPEAGAVGVSRHHTRRAALSPGRPRVPSAGRRARVGHAGECGVPSGTSAAGSARSRVPLAAGRRARDRAAGRSGPWQAPGRGAAGRRLPSGPPPPLGGAGPPDPPTAPRVPVGGVVRAMAGSAADTYAVRDRPPVRRGRPATHRWS
jgi:hypothetical protein